MRRETTPDDIHGMTGAQGILTARGGMTSHAAVVARGMGKPCVAGCSSSSQIDAVARHAHASASDVVREGDTITIDGSDRQGDRSARCRWSPAELDERLRAPSWAGPTSAAA